MYTHQDGFVESCCYGYEHVEMVLEEIKKNFDEYFDKFVETCAGTVASESEFQQLKDKFGASNTGNKANRDLKNNYKSIIIEAYEDFEKDRDKYIDIFDVEALEEYEDNPAAFKSKTL